MRCRPVEFLLAIVLGSIPCLGQTPTTAPADQTRANQTGADQRGADQTQPDQARAMRSAIIQLSDKDPATRDAAREQLMGIAASDLPTLHGVVEQLGPLPPGDADALRDIVEQVYLVGENEKIITAGSGFMGIVMDDSICADGADQSEVAMRTMVQMRLPGFDGYRKLRDGDIITAISTDQDDAASVPIAVHSHEDVRSTVSRCKPGQQVYLQIIRHGKPLAVTVSLSAKPMELDTVPGNQPEPDVYLTTLKAKADAYWQSHFAPLVDDSVS